jgi:hypothetical protein
MKTLFFDLENIARPEHIFHPGKRSRFGGRPNGFCADLAYILVFGYRWLDDFKSHSIETPSRIFKKDPIGDHHILEQIAEVMNQADQIVTWYGSGHDYPFLISRLTQAGIKLDPNIRHIDLMKVASKHLRLSSNSLNNVAKFLGTEIKDVSHHEWWPQCWSGNIEALKKMAKYCRQDVDVLYQVWEKMIDLAPLHAKHLYKPLEMGAECPKCELGKLVGNGHRVTLTRTYKRLRCDGCGSGFKGPMIKDRKR